MLIPYTTDAPVYHWPYATVGLIAANVVAFYGAHVGPLGPVEAWVLTYGDGLHPVQWVSSMFMHGDFMHLIGNMVFLWVFGLVTEGKLGWWRFLACYLGIGIVQNVVEQLVMFDFRGDVPGSLGASAAIFGLIAMAAVWAPFNNVHCYLLLGIGIAVRSVAMDVRIWAFAMLYVGLDILSIIRAGGGPGSGWLHMSGFLVGVVPAIALLRFHLVDCEGWDLFTRLRQQHATPVREVSRAEILAAARASDERRNAEHREAARAHLADLVRDDNLEAAATLYRTIRGLAGPPEIERLQLLAIIKWLHEQKRWVDSTPLLADMIERFPEYSAPARIKLAQICVVELERPRKALELLAGVNLRALPAESTRVTKMIIARAKQMLADGTIEIDSDTW
jgi:membrane associated rhomboid family serine protease